MLIKTRGIIFHAKKYSETSLIVDVFTEEKGLRSYIISGVRSKKSRVSASILQIMSLVDLVAYHRDDRDLTRIKEIKAAHVYQSLPFDVRKSAVGQFMIELVRKTIRESEENRALFEFLFRSFQFLDETKEPFGNIHLHFMLQLTAFLGFIPSGQFDSETSFFDLKEGVFISGHAGHPHYLEEESSSLVSALLDCKIEDCHKIKMNRSKRHELVGSILDYYRMHIDYLPIINSHSILKEVLS